MPKIPVPLAVLAAVIAIALGLSALYGVLQPEQESLLLEPSDRNEAVRLGTLDEHPTEIAAPTLPSVPTLPAGTRLARTHGAGASATEAGDDLSAEMRLLSEARRTMPEDPVGAAKRFLKSGPRRRGRDLVYRLVDANPLVRPMVMGKAGDMARAKSGGHYPALDKAIGAVQAGLSSPESGFAAEEKALAYNLGELWVGVMVQNEAARRWYEKRGFRFVREEPFRMGGTTVPHLIGYRVIGESN